MRANFSPEYIDLCRRLALPKTLQLGEWFHTHVEPGPDAHPMPKEVEMWRDLEHTISTVHNPSLVWLPLEGDWLDLLEAESTYPIIGLRPAKDGSGYGVDTAEGDDGEAAFGPDRLTALARLYAAVKGIDL